MENMDGTKKNLDETRNRWTDTEKTHPMRKITVTDYFHKSDFVLEEFENTEEIVAVQYTKDAAFIYY